ncbi:unnamed protein product [Musa textilis]
MQDCQGEILQPRRSQSAILVIPNRVLTNKIAFDQTTYKVIAERKESIQEHDLIQESIRWLRSRCKRWKLLSEGGCEICGSPLCITKPRKFHFPCISTRTLFSCYHSSD